MVSFSSLFFLFARQHYYNVEQLHRMFRFHEMRRQVEDVGEVNKMGTHCSPVRK